MPTSIEPNATDDYQRALEEAPSRIGTPALIEEVALSVTWDDVRAAVHKGSTTYSEMAVDTAIEFPQRHVERTVTHSTSADDDSDIPDPTYGYFAIFRNPPPDVRYLPDARTDDDAIATVKTIAQDSAATVDLRHRADFGTIDLGTAHPDGTFTPATTMPAHAPGQ